MAIQTTSVGAAPQFNIPYNVTVPNVGAGYAAGITQAGSSIANAITNVADIYNQNQSANDTLSQLALMKDASGNPIIPPDEYQSLMTKSLGAKHEMIGLLVGRFQQQYQAQLEQAKGVAIAQATAAAQAPYRMQEIAAQGAQQRQTTEAEVAAQTKAYLMQHPGSRPVLPAPPETKSPPASGANNIKSPLQLKLEANQNAPTPNLNNPNLQLFPSS
jgi:hypothetical protein